MTDRADLVVVGAGTIGGWASVFAAADGVGRVVVLERGLAGMGASSRAAGIVRAQGGTPATVALGRWSIDFYRGQPAAYGTDSGLSRARLPDPGRHRGRRAGRPRARRDAARGRPDRRPLADGRGGRRRSSGTLAPDGHRGGSYRDGDGHIDPPRNVRAYSLAMQAAGVELRERTAFTGLRTSDERRSRVVAVETTPASIETDRVLLTGGPSLRAVGALRGSADPGRVPRGTPLPSWSRTRRSPSIGCRWCSTSAPGCTGGSRRAGCSSAGATPTSSPARRARSTGRRTTRYRARLAELRADHARPRSAQDLGGDDRLHARPPADPRPGDAAGWLGHRRRHGRSCRRSRDDVGPGRRPCRRRPRAPRRDRADRRVGPRARPLRRARAGAGSRATRSRCRTRPSPATDATRRGVARPVATGSRGARVVHADGPPSAARELAEPGNSLGSQRIPDPGPRRSAVDPAGFAQDLEVVRHGRLADLAAGREVAGADLGASLSWRRIARRVGSAAAWSRQHVRIGLPFHDDQHIDKCLYRQVSI